MGGSDHPSNVVQLSVEQHAEEHRKLYEQYHRWQDKIAWLGLAKLITKPEAIKESIRLGGSKGAMITNARYPKGTRKNWKLGFKKGNQLTAKLYELQSPTGERVVVEGLSKWCLENGMNVKSFHKQVVERRKSHKGWTLLGPENKVSTGNENEREACTGDRPVKLSNF